VGKGTQKLGKAGHRDASEIKQAYPLHPKAPAHIKWATRAIKDLVYMVTDKGPQQQWLKEIGKTDEPWCVCDGWMPQNAAHLQQCPWVADGVGRSTEQMWRDERYCEQVFEFIL